jgi:hypothetical protein
MLAQGIESSDQAAADDWIRDFNARGGGAAKVVV